MSSVTKRYAKAIASLPESNQDAKDMFEEVRELTEAILTSGAYELFAQPRIEASKKREILESILSSANATKSVGNVFRLLLAKGRLEVLKNLIPELEKLMDEKLNILRVHVTTAGEVSQKALEGFSKDLSEKLSKEVILDSSVNPELMGGAVANISGKIYDASVRNRLQSIQNSIL